MTKKDNMKPRTLAMERLRDWPVRPSNKFLVAGPCSVESEAQVLQTALDLAAYDVTVLRGGIWKPRTHPGSFEGVGIPGLRLAEASRPGGRATRGNRSREPLPRARVPQGRD